MVVARFSDLTSCHEAVLLIQAQDMPRPAPLALARSSVRNVALPLLPCSTYRDDGLHAKMQPLMQTASELTSDLAYMGKVRAAPAVHDMPAMHAPCITPAATMPRSPASALQRACLVPNLCLLPRMALQLLEAASAEFYILRAPHTFPTQQYK